MSNLERRFKVAGDIGHKIAENLENTANGLADGDVVTIKDFLSLYEGRTVGVGVPPGLWRIIGLNALSMVAEGKTCGEAGRFYDVSGHDVQEWRNAYLVSGLRGV